MSKQALKQMIDEANWWVKLSGKGKELAIDTLTQEDANNIFHKIDSGLSPENLHCDGEISRAQAQAKYNMYMDAVQELVDMGFNIPNDVYELA